MTNTPIIHNTMSEAEVKNDVAAEAPSAEDLKAKKRSAEDDDVDVKKQKTENGDHAENGEEEEDAEEEEDIGEEANGKIEAANVRIRALRRERDDAVADAERKRAESFSTIAERDELTAERASLAKQKE